MFQHQQELIDKTSLFYHFLREKGEKEFSFPQIIKEFEENLDFAQAWAIVWYGIGKDWWEITDEYKVILKGIE